MSSPRHRFGNGSWNHDSAYSNRSTLIQVAFFRGFLRLLAKKSFFSAISQSVLSSRPPSGPHLLTFRTFHLFSPSVLGRRAATKLDT